MKQLSIYPYQSSPPFYHLSNPLQKTYDWSTTVAPHGLHPLPHGLHLLPISFHHTRFLFPCQRYTINFFLSAETYNQTKHLSVFFPTFSSFISSQTFHFFRSDRFAAQTRIDEAIVSLPPLVFLSILSPFESLAKDIQLVYNGYGVHRGVRVGVDGGVHGKVHR